MDHELLVKLTYTSLLFLLMFIAAARFYGNEAPYDAKQIFSALGFLFSSAASFVFVLALIWAS